MTTRALVVPRHHEALECAEVVRKWRRVDIGDWAVLTTPMTPILTDDREIAMIGSAFGQNGDAVTALTPGFAHAVIGSDGRWLAESTWGQFLAVWRDRRDGALTLYRDPSGATPLFRATSPHALAFTDLADAAPFLDHAPAIDWTALTHQLVFLDCPTRACAIAGIEQILPGERARLDGAASQLVWSPWRFAARDATATWTNAVGAVRQAVMLAVGGFAAVEPSPLLLELSGGLDSSIVASCLALSERPWSALTLATPGEDGDERRYAREVAEHVGAPIRERLLTALDIDLTAPELMPAPSPNGFGMLRGVDRAIAVAASDASAQTLVSGTGGDNVFFAVRSPAPIVDAFRAGKGFAAARAARDLAAIGGVTIASVIGATWRYSWREWRHKDRWPFSYDFLSRDCRPQLALHSWLIAPRKRLPGRRAHIGMLLRAHAVTGAHARSRASNMVFPLMARPVIEACLAVPSWMTIAGARDRAVARAAFAGDLPSVVIDRRGKGALESLIGPAFARDRGVIRERLLDGRLAAAGVLDRTAIDRTLRVPDPTEDVVRRVLHLLDSELWIAAVAERAPSCAPVRIGGIGKLDSS